MAMAMTARSQRDRHLDQGEPLIAANGGAKVIHDQVSLYSMIRGEVGAHGHGAPVLVRTPTRDDIHALAVGNGTVVRDRRNDW